ncbi:PREDICTED: uncharacterized protein LOC105956260 [Erythranthe guttata]|uniref:uncharacterized protein LOC105956260 n=1 Tax=Erythranthe guttata TaxID=4155 RepID=UPI00064E12DB|nr:PREDICTED: uncharacterized protein LOC105956260 [Erythranthe guttata]|eukprot:XP_012835559.1 PREDICTED: uncharacterized protein LOC105956260 [Erythranthe guttata]
MTSSKQRELNSAIESYVMLEEFRLDCGQLQKELRTKPFQGILHSLGIYGENDFANVGKLFLLPSSFTGGPREMKKRLNKQPRHIDSSAIKDFRNDYGTPEITIGARKLFGEAHEPIRVEDEYCGTSVNQVL